MTTIESGSIFCSVVNQVWSRSREIGTTWFATNLNSIPTSGRLVVLPKRTAGDMRELYRVLVERRVTMLSITPSAFLALQSVIPMPAHELSLCYVQLAGEALQPASLAPWFDQRLGAAAGMPKFINMYGPTEATVYCTIKEITLDDVRRGTSNIGRIFDDMAACIVNQAGQLQPIGVAGELLLFGAGLARGYLNRPDLTAEKFPVDAFGQERSGRWYRTGDLGRWLPSGELEYLGRIDKQVKVRGYRIELGEVESHLLLHPLVSEAVVVALGEIEARYLAAYIVAADLPADEQGDLIGELKQSLTTALPHYMVPEAFAILPKLPLNANGKLDRRALSEMILAKASDSYVAPRSTVEAEVAEIWCALLNLERVSMTANFFEIGGQSLTGIRVINEISKRYGVEVGPRIIFEYNTIEALAMYIEVNLWGRKGALEAAASADEDEDEFLI